MSVPADPSTGQLAPNSGLPSLTKTDPVADRRGVAILLWGAASSLGLLFLNVAGNSVTRLALTRSVHIDEFAGYLPVVVPVLGLVAWLLAPRRAAGWLLLAGVVCVAPIAVLAITPATIDGAVADLVVVSGAGATQLIAIGVLAAATIAWRQRLRGPAGALIGASVVAAPVGEVVLHAGGGDIRYARGTGQMSTGFFDVLTIAFLVLAAVGAVVVLVRTRNGVGPERAGRPALPAVCGGIVALLAVMILPLVWQPSNVEEVTGRAGSYLPLFVTVLLLVGVFAGVLAGPRLLAAAAILGLVTGSFRILMNPLHAAFADLPALTITCAVLALLVGVAVAASAQRHRIGPTGLGAAAAGVLVLFWALGSRDAFDEHRELIIAVTAVLLVVAMVGATATAAAIGELTSPLLATPAVFVGVAAPFSVAAGYGGQLLTVRLTGRAPVDAALLPAGIALLLAAGLAAWLLAGRSGRADEGPASDNRAIELPGQRWE
jgi:hypothetical protein